MKQHYETLGVPEGAPLPDMKRAYRALRRKHHPDHGGDAEAFRKVQEAYEYLTGERTEAPKGPTKEQRIYQMLVQVWAQLADPFDRPSRQLAKVKKDIQNGLKMTPAQIPEKKKKLAELETLRGLVDSGDSEMNAYEDMLNIKISQAREDIQATEDALEALKIVAKMIEGYKLTEAGQQRDQMLAEKEERDNFAGKTANEILLQIEQSMRGRRF